MEEETEETRSSSLEDLGGQLEEMLSMPLELQLEEFSVDRGKVELQLESPDFLLHYHQGEVSFSSELFLKRDSFQLSGNLELKPQGVKKSMGFLSKKKRRARFLFLHPQCREMGPGTPKGEKSVFVFPQERRTGTLAPRGKWNPGRSWALLPGVFQPVDLGANIPGGPENFSLAPEAF